MGSLQQTLAGLEDVESELRYAARKGTLALLEDAWKRGKRPSETEIRAVRAALEALRP